MKVCLKQRFCLLLKILTVISSIGGLIISLINAKFDGYSHWSKRLLYFTAQSNVWIGVTFLVLIFFPLLKIKNSAVWKNRLYVLKYIFTVSITVTGLVFCFLLAPFADESYHVWSVSGFLTHVFSPVFAIADFFIDDYKIPLLHKQTYLSVIPPALYVLTSAILTAVNFDFGRGDNYPYFFMNYFSPAGLFGFSNVSPFFVGSFYWILALALITFFLGKLYQKLKTHKSSRTYPN